VARAYVVGSPRGRGKRIVILAAQSFLPAEAREFDADLPGGGVIRLRWDEVIGRRILESGGFEVAEIQALGGLAEAGTCVFDVGANVGLLTVPLGRAVGPQGIVVAVEPLPENVARLRRNADRNGLANVRTIEAAAAAEDGQMVFNLAQDPAFGSLGALTKATKIGDLVVSVRSLDSIWRELGEPRVSLLKIDVEGGEFDVVRGAEAIIARHAPCLLFEANSDAASPLFEHLRRLDYSDATPSGIVDNRVFVKG
jgi:FkbM family methyltransferase